MTKIEVVLEGTKVSVRPDSATAKRGDTIQWEGKPQFWIEFPEGSPFEWTSRGSRQAQLRGTVRAANCRDDCSTVFKYTVIASDGRTIGSVDPDIIVPRPPRGA